MAFQSVHVERVVPFDLILELHQQKTIFNQIECKQREMGAEKDLVGGCVVVGSGMGFLGGRRTGGLLIIDLGIKVLGDGGDLGSLATEVVGDEEEGDNSAYNGGEQGNGDGGDEGDR